MFVVRATILSLLLVGSNAFAPSQPLREMSSSLRSTEVAAVEAVDVSIPYDATVQLAYEASDKSISYDEFKPKYLAESVAEVVAKQSGAASAEAKSSDSDDGKETIVDKVLKTDDEEEKVDEIVYYKRKRTLSEKEVYLYLPKNRRE